VGTAGEYSTLASITTTTKSPTYRFCPDHYLNDIHQIFTGYSRSSVVPTASLQLLPIVAARAAAVRDEACAEDPGLQFTDPGSASASGFFVAVFTVGRRGYALSRQGRRLSQMSCRCERRRTTRARTRVMVTVHAAAPRSAYHHLRHSVAWSSRPPATRAAPGGTQAARLSFEVG
jgi:hypothetical protein